MTATHAALLALVPFLGACSILGDLLPKNTASAAPEPTRTVEFTGKLPQFAFRGANDRWQPMPVSGLRGVLTFSDASKTITDAASFDTASGKAGARVKAASSFLNASLNADGVIAEATGALSNQVTLALRPILTEVSVIAPKTAPKTGESLKLEYLVFGPAYRVLVDDSMLVSMSFTAGGEYALVKGTNANAINIEVQQGTPVGSVIAGRVSVRNASLEGQSHSMNAVEGIFEFKVGGPP